MASRIGASARSKVRRLPPSPTPTLSTPENPPGSPVMEPRPSNSATPSGSGTNTSVLSRPRIGREAKKAANEALKMILELSAAESEYQNLRPYAFSYVSLTQTDGQKSFSCTISGPRIPEDDDGDWSSSESEAEEIGKRNVTRSKSRTDASRRRRQRISRLSLSPGTVRKVSQVVFEELFGSAITEHLLKRVPENGSSSLSALDACYWGLTESQRLEKTSSITHEALSDDSNDSPIDMMVRADRVFFYSSDGPRPPHGTNPSNLQNGSFYGSSLFVQRSAGPNAQAEWHPIYLYTLRRHFLSPDGHVELPHVARTDADTVITLSSELEHAFLDELFSFCIRNPNKVYRSDNICARPTSSRIEKYLNFSILVPCVNTGYECAKAAVVNAISLVDSKDVAFKFADETPPLRARFLKDVQKYVEFHGRRYALQWLRDGDGQKYELAEIDWLVHEARGVFFVNLIGSEGLSHMVCVDARSAQNRLIYDSSERYSAVLCKEALESCTGDEIQLLKMYVRRFVLLKVGTKRRATNRSARHRKASRRVARNL